MVLVTFVLEDTPSGQVAVLSSFDPAIGQPKQTPAQSMAMQLITVASSLQPLTPEQRGLIAGLRPGEVLLAPMN